MPAFCHFRALAAALAALLMLAGCSADMQSARNDVAETGTRVESDLGRFASRPTQRAGAAQFSDGLFMAPAAQRTSQAGLLPARVQGASAITLVSRDPLTLTDIADRLTDLTGLSHVTALGPAQRVRRDPQDTTQAAGEEGAGAPAGRTRASDAAPGRANRIAVRPRLRGPLSDVLDEIASLFAVEWSYEDGRVVFRDYVTRQYQLSVLPSAQSRSSSIAGVSSAASYNVLGEVQTTIEGLLGEGSITTVGASTGTITVTALIADQERIRQYVARMNAMLGQQIAFDVNVITVTLSQENGVGINLGAALSKAGAGAEWLGASTLDNTTSALNFGIVRGEFSLNGLVAALATQGDVAVDTRAGGTTTNNRVVPLEVVEEIGYVAETELLRDDEGNIESIQQTVTTVTTGFTLDLMPRVLNTREIMVEYALEISDLNRFRDFGAGDTAVQLPETSSTSFEQQVILENGQTLVLAGFERRRIAATSSGVGKPDFIVLGGDQSVKMERVSQVITITPRLLSRRAGTR